jgi:hypothetical protein
MASMVVGGLAFIGIALFASIALVGAIIFAALRIILLPLLLLKWIVVGTVMLVVGPILFLVGLVAFIAAAIVLALPLLPFLMLGAIVWVIVRSNRRPAVA